MRRIYFSRKFYTSRPFSALEPDTEIQALEWLIRRLEARGEYRVANIARSRITEIRNTQQALVQKYHTLLTIEYSLN